MKKVIIVSAVMCFFVCSFLLIVQPVSASTAWTTTDGDSTLINLKALLGVPLTGTIGIFDLSQDVSSDNSLNLLSGNTMSQSFKTYKDDSKRWFASKIDSFGIPLGNPLSLSSNQFGFYYKTDNTYLTDYTINHLEWNNFVLTWTVPSGNNVPSYVSILANDVTDPVPVPSALLLLGSGFAGLLGFKRRIKTFKNNL